MSPLPDLGEEIALRFLNNMCKGINKIYPIGSKIILCCDGRVFSDVVGMKKNDVTSYQQKLSLMIERIDAKNISIFNLDDVWPNDNFNLMRLRLMEIFGLPLNHLKEQIRDGSNASTNKEDSELFQMYLGITRF